MEHQPVSPFIYSIKLLHYSKILKKKNPHTKSYALLKYNPKQYIATEEILMLTIHGEIHSITNF